MVIFEMEICNKLKWREKFLERFKYLPRKWETSTLNLKIYMNVVTTFKLLKKRFQYVIVSSYGKKVFLLDFKQIVRLWSIVYVSFVEFCERWLIKIWRNRIYVRKKTLQKFENFEKYIDFHDERRNFIFFIFIFIE